MKDTRLKSDLLRFSYIKRFIKGKDILDIGSAEGSLHNFLLKHGKNHQIWSCDISNSDFNRNLNNKFKINKKFDTIIAGEIIEHLENPTSFLSECKKILKKGGRIIITTPNAIGLQYILNPAWCVENYPKAQHLGCFTAPMLAKRIQELGYRLVHIDYINAFWINNPLKIFSAIFKKFRPDLMIVAEN